MFQWHCFLCVMCCFLLMMPEKSRVKILFGCNLWNSRIFFWRILFLTYVQIKSVLVKKTSICQINAMTFFFHLLFFLVVESVFLLEIHVQSRQEKFGNVKFWFCFFLSRLLNVDTNVGSVSTYLTYFYWVCKTGVFSPPYKKKRLPMKL